MSRPSSLPMLQQCGRFESAGSVDADGGQVRHQYLKALGQCHLSGNDGADVYEAEVIAGQLPEDEIEAVYWAWDYIKMVAPMRDHPVRFETHVNPIGDDLNPLFENGGTADAICGPELFDFKWRPRDYTAQMAAYALDIFQNSNIERVRVHLLFGAVKRHEVYWLDEPSARALVVGIIEHVATKPEPTPCDYCGWCANRLTCPALIKRARFVSVNYADEPLMTQVANWHPSEMTKPEDIALGLLVWRKILNVWGKSMEFHALKAALAGIDLPGFELKDGTGKSYINDIAEAHRLSGLENDVFLKACDLRLNTSKKYPDKVGLSELYATANGMKVTPAKKQLKKKLEPVTQKGNSKKKLVFVGDDDEDENTEE